MSSVVRQLTKQLNDILVVQLELIIPFIEDPLIGERYGLLSFTGWQRDNAQSVSVECQLWVTEGFAGYSQLETGRIQLLETLDQLVPRLPVYLNNNTLNRLDWDGRFSSTMRAPLKAPDDQSSHIWITDITAVINLTLYAPNFAWDAGGVIV